MVKAWIATAAGLLALSGPVAATAPLAALRAAEARSYRFDLARNFFATPAGEVAARRAVVAAIDDLERLAETATSPTEFAAAMNADDRAQRLFRKHDLYLFLRFAVDMREGAGMVAADDLRARLRAARDKLKRVVLANGDFLFGRGSGEGSAVIERYRFWFDQARRDADHRLSRDQQQVVDALGQLIGGGAYPLLIRDLTFAPVVLGGKALDPRRDESLLESNPSPAVRRAGSRQLLAGYATRRDQLADLLIRVAQGGDALARLHKHGGAVEQVAFEAYVTPAQYRSLLAEVARNASVFKEWQRRVQDPFSRPGNWSPAKAAALTVQSAHAIAPAYAAEFSALLHLSNGRADLAGTGQRLPIQGTASVYPIGVSAIYMQDYQGNLLDLVILAHEAGHAVQAQLMYRAGVPMAYGAGPGYFTESFGRFQELVLLDRLYRTATETKRRAWLRDALAARLLSVFNSAEEAAVELAIYDAVRVGAAKGADDLDQVTASASAAYTNRIADKPEMRGMWMLSEGYYQAPFQELNDAFASLLAVRYFQLYRQDPGKFGPAYMGLLRGGYNDEPRALLRRNLGIDMASPDFVAATLATLRVEVNALYR